MRYEKRKGAPTRRSGEVGAFLLEKVSCGRNYDRNFRYIIIPPWSCLSFLHSPMHGFDVLAHLLGDLFRRLACSYSAHSET